MMNDETALERRRRTERWRASFVMRVPRRRKTKLNDYLLISGSTTLYRTTPDEIARILMTGAQDHHSLH